MAVQLGRWQAAPKSDANETEILVELTDTMLDRYGVLTRGSVAAESIPAGFQSVYQVLGAMELNSAVRRGYFVEGLGAAQFAIPGAVDRLRQADTAPHRSLLIAACDPANPWGAALPWPQSDGHRPSRSAGALVVLDNGAPVLYLGHGSRSATTFGNPDQNRLGSAFRLVSDAVDAGRLPAVTITKINDEPSLNATRFHTAFQLGGFTMSPSGWRHRR
jgi:ATP-dependent Lhr-like helicase